MGRRIRAALCVAAALAVDGGEGLAESLSNPTVKVAGRVEMSQAKRRRDLSGVVVYLVPRQESYEMPRATGEPAISQKKAQFSPPVLVVVKGQTVDFTNDDTVDHNVYSHADPKTFNLGVYPKGAYKSVTFDKVGVVPILCSIHEKMSGTIFVVPNPLFDLTDGRGHFSIHNVPEGVYDVHTWHASLPAGESTLTVTGTDVIRNKPLPLSVDLTAPAAPGEVGTGGR